KGQARVIPIILRPVHWQDAPFGKLQVLPVDGQPVTRKQIDEALRDIANTLWKTIRASFALDGQSDHISSAQDNGEDKITRLPPAHPFIEVLGPDGQQFHLELTKDRVTIGRLEQYNDIALLPDPQQLISRKGHCALERDEDGWWVIDNGSVNRTFV